jgi:hypothetical protein
MQRLPAIVRQHRSTLACAVFVPCVLAATLPGGTEALAVYALSFWHYALYWLAYRHGCMRQDVFMRDAVLMKSVALLALGWAYLAAPADWLSLAVIALGFGLNATAARALGPERTYYGYELSRLPPLKITAFPYGRIAHPMLLGNAAAYGGTLLNAGFRRDWWPLACAHVALNVGLLIMETRVAPLHGAAVRAPRANALVAGAAMAAAGAALGAAAGLADASPVLLPWAAVGAGSGVHLFVIFRWYTSPATPPRGGDNVPAEASHE